MKKIIIVFIALTMLCSSIDAAFTPAASEKTEQTAEAQARAMAEKFTTMSRKDYEQLTGKHFNFFERIAFKIAQHKLKHALKKDGDPSTNTLLLVILAIFIPPLAVYLFEGAITKNFWINLLLTLLFFLPGMIHALILILGNKN